MTAVIMMFEMTGDYKIILPLMLAVVGSSLFSSRLLGGESIYTMKLTRRGVRLRRGRDVDVLEGVRVGDALSQTLTVRPDTSVQELRELFLRTNRHAFPVVADEDRLVGIVSLTDVRNAAAKRDTSSLEVQDLMTRELITAFPDETLDTVLRRMGPRDLSRLPVVDRDNPTRLLGVIRRNDIVRAYNLALTDRDRDRPELPQHIRSGPTVELIEIDLPHTSAVVGKTVRDLAERMPAESLLISIRRPSGEVVFPHGSTRLGGGDRITAWARRGQVQELLRCFDGL
jgi:CIC family chloride channel protein